MGAAKQLFLKKTHQKLRLDNIKKLFPNALATIHIKLAFEACRWLDPNKRKPSNRESLAVGPTRWLGTSWSRTYRFHNWFLEWCRITKGVLSYNYDTRRIDVVVHDLFGQKWSGFPRTPRACKRLRLFQLQLNGRIVQTQIPKNYPMANAINKWK